MKEAVQYANSRLKRTMAVGLSIFIIWVAGANLGPPFETRFFPVVRDFRVERAVMSDDNRNMTIWVSFVKMRRCAFVDMTWYVGRPDADFERVPLEFKDLNSGPNSTRPKGRNYAGPWLVWTSFAPDIKQPIDDQWQFSVVRHNCGLPWLTETVQGPFKLPSSSQAQ